MTTKNHTVKSYAAERGVSYQRVAAILKRISDCQEAPSKTNERRIERLTEALELTGKGPTVKNIEIIKVGRERLLIITYL